MNVQPEPRLGRQVVGGVVTGVLFVLVLIFVVAVAGTEDVSPGQLIGMVLLLILAGALTANVWWRFFRMLARRRR